ASAVVLLVATASPPQTAKNPLFVLLPQGADPPQTAKLPQLVDPPHTAKLLPTKTFPPQTAKLLQSTEPPQTANESFTKYTLCVAGSYCTTGDLAAPALSAVLARAA